jgi:hypothetical protein
MFTDQDVEIVTGRLTAWSELLGRLADPTACRQLLSVLDEANGKGFHKLLDEWNFPGAGCIEIVDTITRFVHTGDYEPVETCSFVNRLRPAHPSTTSGKGYQLRDGSILWLTEAQWWEMMDRAAQDATWRTANHDLLVDVGIMVCTFELVPSVARFDFDKRYTICPPNGRPDARRSR